MEFQYASTIDEKGYARFPFTHASDYAIVLDDGALLTEELAALTLTSGSKILYTGGNTGKQTGLKLNMPAGLQNLTEEDSLYPTVTYTSSNPEAVTVTVDGTVKAGKAGKATITATVTIGGTKQVLTTGITVKKAYIKLVKGKSSLKTGESFTYRAKGYGVSTDKITWATTKKAVVVISKKTGKAIAKTAGTDYVAAKYGSIKKTVKVTVK